eukprot:2762776-Pleurochrysis_carterae.AAC.1
MLCPASVPASIRELASSAFMLGRRVLLNSAYTPRVCGFRHRSMGEMPTFNLRSVGKGPSYFWCGP